VAHLIADDVILVSRSARSAEETEPDEPAEAMDENQ